MGLFNGEHYRKGKTPTTETITLAKPLSRYKFICVEYEVEINLPASNAFMYGNLFPITKLSLGNIRDAIAYTNVYATLRITKLSDTSLSIKHEDLNFGGGIAYRIIGIS